MGISARLQFLACLMLYASSAHAIMVKYGTKGGPIEPLTPEPELPVPQPYRAPAPVWEERSNDAPDPNAQWRPQLFNPQPRYTQPVFKPAAVPTPKPSPLNNAQRFVNAYIPTDQQYRPVTNFFTPAFLGSQSLPGIGLRYFVPAYYDVQAKQEDAKQNHIENDVSIGSPDAASDVQWKYEKDLTRRTLGSTQTAIPVPVYVWPAYVPRAHQ